MHLIADEQELFDRKKEEQAYRASVFRQKQKLPYDAKILHAEIRAKEFYNTVENCHISVGGLDSITLYLFLQNIGICVPAISVSTLEDKSIQEIHKKLGVISLKPSVKYIDDSGNEHRWTKTGIIQELGFPVISKEKATKIETLQNPTERNKTVRHAIITGETGKQGGYTKNSKMKLPQKWLDLFGGLENENECVNYQIAPFKVSSKCCYYLKEKPCDDWAKEHNSFPYLGLMASEGGRREKSLAINGCNYYGKTVTRSAPFAIFTRQDLLRLALDLNVPVPSVYGEIKEKEDGTLYTTKAQRTGCSMCGFGIHIEERPHRFDRLRETNFKEWHYWMYECCIDDNGEKFGWGKVLDYIGVEWL